jgi:serine phosphatase RsbU (regulator of sigma subunit)
MRNSYPREHLPTRYIELKYRQYINSEIASSGILKLSALSGSVFLLFIFDYLSLGILPAFLAGLMPILALVIFISLRLSLFRQRNRGAMLWHNIFLACLVFSAYMLLLFSAEGYISNLSAARLILVVAIIGMETKGGSVSVFLMQTPPLVLFLVSAWWADFPFDARMALLMAQVCGLLCIHAAISYRSNKLNYRAFIKEQNMLYEQSRSRTLIDELRETNKRIEEQAEEIQTQKEEIVAQTDEITAQRDLAERQRDMIVAQKDELTDSIIYAKRIQVAMLPGKEVFSGSVSESMLLFMPKDIVSGDFYWASRMGAHIVFCVADCTGHGVPGGFMSMLGISFLNEIVSKHKQIIPNLILHDLRDNVVSALRQDCSYSSPCDGMDMGLACLDINTGKLYFSGANNYMLLFRAGDTDPIELKGDKMPIAIYPVMKEFTLLSIDVRKGDSLYLFSDGFADQFGGPKGKKFLMKNFKRLLASVQELSMDQQKIELEQTIKGWMKNHPKDPGAVTAQIDDITVLGIRI